MNSISFDIGEQNWAAIFSSSSLKDDLREEKKQDFEGQLKFSEVFATSKITIWVSLKSEKNFENFLPNFALWILLMSLPVSWWFSQQQ